MFKASDNSLRKIQHDNGSIQYDIQPGNGLISLSKAIQIASGVAENAHVTEFELDKEVWWGPKYGNKWVYAIEFQDRAGDFKVIVDATSGKVLGYGA